MNLSLLKSHNNIIIIANNRREIKKKKKKKRRDMEITQIIEMTKKKNRVPRVAKR